MTDADPYADRFFDLIPSGKTAAEIADECGQRDAEGRPFAEIAAMIRAAARR